MTRIPDVARRTKHLAVAISATFVLGGCSVQPVPDPSGPVPLVRGSAASFQPLLRESTESPSCVDPVDAPLPAGGRAVALLYPESPRRQVTVTVDRSGVPIKYLDVRGDLSEADDDMGDRTTIGLYLTEGYAVLSNREGERRPEILEVPLDEVLTSVELGDPTQEMEHVLNRCDPAA